MNKSDIEANKNRLNDKDKACDILKIKEFTIVNDCFQNEHNEVFGVFLSETR